MKPNFLAVLLIAAVSVSFASAPGNVAVPWVDGERLLYTISWKGLVIGRQVIEAHKSAAGWHYTGQVESNGLAELVGFDMSVSSYVRPDLHTRSFRRVLVVPREGKRVLEVTVDEQTHVSLTWVDGSVHRFSSNQTDVLDDASVLYYVRVHPYAQKLWFVNYPRLIAGQLRALGKKTVKTRLGRLAAEGYYFASEDTRIEVWYSVTKERWPLRIYFGQKWGGFTAELIKVEYVH